MDNESFQVLADPARRSIVEALRGGDHSVGEIVAGMGIQQSGVSRHLRILQHAGFVRVRPEGTRRVYSLRPERFIEFDEWIGRYRTLWAARLDRFGDALDDQDSRNNNQGEK